jgi:osmotically inducible protein OsmC
MSVNVIRTTGAIATWGPGGRVRTADGILDAGLQQPKSSGERGKAGVNPEHLFAAGYAACFFGAMQFVVSQGQSGVRFTEDSTVATEVGIGPSSDGGFGLTVSLTVSVPGADRDAVEDLIEKAHRICPYSNATRNNIDVKFSVA